MCRRYKELECVIRLPLMWQAEELYQRHKNIHYHLQQQPDKFEYIKSIEREKKTIQKKQQETKKKAEVPKPVPKVKRANSINYTREYENGKYADHEDDYDDTYDDMYDL